MNNLLVDNIALLLFFFSELTTTDLILRKLISLVDVTLCLDKRNASGRIESYLVGFKIFFFLINFNDIFLCLKFVTLSKS